MDDDVAGSGYGNPYIDSLIAGCKWVADPGDPPGPLQLSYHFGQGPDPFGVINGLAWSDHEKDAFRQAFELYENVANIQFNEVGTFDQADFVEWLAPSSAFSSPTTLGFHEFPDPSLTVPPPYGVFNVSDPTWANLAQGSFGFVTVIHELGHALGLAHPHDGGFRSDEPDASTFPGVSRNASRDKGDFGLNQGIWTTMSYIDGWDKQPTDSDDFGYQGTAMAFDIAALQELYGANMTYNTGDNTYLLPTQNVSGTFWSCIWDAGGDSDLIDANGATGACKINLNDATLAAKDPNAGGFVSWVQGIVGGFTIANGVVIENATGGSGNDTLTGNEVANILIGNDGNDFLDGGAGADDMLGGTGNDTYVVDDVGDSITDGGGDVDLVQSFLDFVLADLNLENLTLVGTDDVDGTGNALNNLLIGNGGDNALDGGTGKDTMQGGVGDDTYFVDAADDVVTEASKAGTDTVRSKNSYTLGANLENLVLLAAATALMATGNTLANELTGNDEANTLDGKTGADIMTGGKGNDVYVMDVAGDQVIETGSDAKDEVRSAVAFKNAIAGIEDYTFTGKSAVFFTAGAENNTIIATAAADTLDGGAGTDALTGGAGNDVYFVDSSSDKVTELDKGGTDTVKSSQTFVLSEFVEKLELTGGGDIDGTGNALANAITGNSGKNGLFGLGGKDTLTGNDGNDTLDGGADIDRLVGGKGDDTYVVDSSKDVISETLTLLTGGVDLVQSSASFVLGANLDKIELTGGLAIDGTGNTLVNALTGNDEKNKLSGLAGNDELTGKAGNDTLDGGTGDDIMAGGEDDDLYIQDSAKDQFNDTGSTAGDELRTNQSTLTGATGGIEHYTFIGSKAVTFAGGGAANRITGTAAADSLTGDGGNDTLSGLGGNDTLAGGNDQDSLLGGIGNDVLGGGANDDTLDGGAGIDNLDGGAGDDSYVVDNAKDVVKETAGNGIDVINASIAIDLNLPAYDEIENVTLIGTAALKLTGDGQDNALTGNDGANLVTGGAGADTITGGKGNDTLDGSVDGDADALAGGLGNDTYLIGELGEIVTEAEGEGTDIVRSAVSHTLAANVENLVLLAGAVGAIGNGLKNSLTGNEAANTLDGGLLVDTLIGGKGDDTYFVDDAKDVVTEAAGKDTGSDTVHSTAASYILAANVENLILDGTAVSGTGNTLNNILTGNAGNNTLSGGTGKDQMIGNGGDDTYVVDNIGDTVTESGAGIDTVQSSIAFSLAGLGEVENLTLTGAGALAGTGNALANIITGNSGANALAGNDGNDTINGAGGNDKITGGIGADVIAGGVGNDTIDGGAENDLVTGGAGADRINVGDGNDTVFYTSKLDGKDVIDNFDGNATDGQDVLNLDLLFDSLGVADGDRAGRVSFVVNAAGTAVDVKINADANPNFELTVATLNTADPIAVGADVIVGTL